MDKKLSRLKYAMAGFSIMILVNAFGDGFGLFRNIPMILLVVMGVTGLAWLLSVAGFLAAKGVRKEFKYALNASILGVVAVAGEVLMALKDYRSGLAESLHMSMNVMFFEYWSKVFMLIAVYMTMVGLGQLLAKSGEVRRGKKSKELGKICVIVTMASYVLCPMVQILSGTLGDILAIAVLAVGVIAQFIMLNYINNAYRDIDMD